MSHLVSKARAPRLVRKGEESQEEEEEEEDGGGEIQDQGMFVLESNIFWIPKALVRRIDAPLVLVL